ncbi:hypothetical protein ACTJKO_14470 [Curtobacterium sp. 22159]|uniref:hypothetical protein n=1 Tax=Curtobacterium sp. 22159 TaxID=3453882 RepID=UPI003F8443E8
MSSEPSGRAFPPEPHARVHVVFRPFRNEPDRLVARPFITGVFVVGHRAYSAWIVLNGASLRPFTLYEAGVWFLAEDLVRSEMQVGEWFSLSGQPTDIARGQLIGWGPPSSSTPTEVGDGSDLFADPSDVRFSRASAS